jgi:hypothetical protein
VAEETEEDSDTEEIWRMNQSKDLEEEEDMAGEVYDVDEIYN